ncbi:MAG: NAD(P)-dependent oxidoreductase [Acidimicrobiia bacterium]
MTVMPELRLIATSELAARDPDRLGTFREAGFQVVERFDLNGSDDDEQLIDALDGIWGTIAGTEHYTDRVIREATDLAVIARCGVGHDRIDVDSATAHGVAVLTTPGANHHAVADHTMALLLALAGRLQRPGEIQDGKGGRSLTRATVGIVGLGAIGREVAKRLAGFHCRLIGVDPIADEASVAELGVELTSLEEMLPRVDVLTIHIPLTPSTRCLIDTEELESLPDGAIVINTARGGIVNEASLRKELQSGRLLGAGLDVFAQEPLPAESPLALSNRTLLTGHVASYSVQAMQAILALVLQGMIEISSGLVPGTCVNPDAIRDLRHGQLGQVPTRTDVVRR